MNAIVIERSKRLGIFTEMSSVEVRVEVVRTSAHNPSGKACEILAVLQGTTASSLVFRDLQGEQADLEKITTADVLIVYGDDTESLCQAVQQLRGARLVCPIISYRDERYHADNAKLLMAGYDDIFDSAMPIEELIARVQGLHNRAKVYEQRFSQQTTSRRVRRSGEIGYNLFTVRERSVLMALLENREKVVTYADLLKNYGKEPTPQAVHTLQVMMSGLRQKIPDEWSIVSVTRTGYMLLAPSANKSEATKLFMLAS